MSQKHYSQQHKSGTSTVNSSNHGKNRDTNFTYIEGVNETKTLYQGNMDRNLDMGNTLKVPKNYKSLCKQKIDEIDRTIWGDVGLFGLFTVLAILTDYFDFPDLKYPISLIALSVMLSTAHRAANLIILKFRFKNLRKSKHTFEMDQFVLEVERLNKIIDGRLFINRFLSFFGK